MAQKLKEIPPGMRTNSSHMVCFNLRNKKEELGFLSENEGIEGLAKKYAEATTGQFNFLYLNKTTSKVYKNFEKEL